MKKRLILLATVFIFIFNTVSTLADNSQQTIPVHFNMVNLNVNGNPVNADNILYNGTTYVPLRKAAEILGCEVGWNGETNTATIMRYNEKTEIAFVFECLYEAGRITDLCDNIYSYSDFRFNKSHWTGYFHNSDITYYQGLADDVKYISEYYNSLIKYKEMMYIILSDLTSKENLDGFYQKLDEVYNKTAYIYSLVKNLVESSGFICTETEFINDIYLLFDIKEELENYHSEIYFDYLKYLYN